MLVPLLLMNAAGFGIMLLDKNLARHHRRRVPEALLLAFAACFGSAGVLAGMLIGHHKTQKAPVHRDGARAAARAGRGTISPVRSLTELALVALGVDDIGVVQLLAQIAHDGIDVGPAELCPLLVFLRREADGLCLARKLVDALDVSLFHSNAPYRNLVISIAMRPFFVLPPIVSSRILPRPRMVITSPSAACLSPFMQGA